MIKRPYFSEREGEHFLKKSYPLIDTIMHKFPSIIVTRTATYLHIHPNYITGSSVVMAFICAYFLATNQLILGALFYWFRAILDSSDGKTARLQGKASEFGGKLDYGGDLISHACMYFGIWWSQYYLHGDWWLGGLIIFAHYIIMFSGNIFLPRGDYTYKTVIPKVHSYYCSFDESYITFMFAPLFNVIRIVMPIAVALQFVSYMILFKIKGESVSIPELKTKIRILLKKE